VFHPEREQVAHYYRFMELKLGRRYQRGDTRLSGPTGEAINIDWGGVRPMRANPHSSDHDPKSATAAAQLEFDRLYCRILHGAEEAFTGTPEALGPAMGAMFQLKAQAETLMQMRSADSLSTAGPTFMYVPVSRRSPQ
jgi:hypothetical protein